MNYEIIQMNEIDDANKQSTYYERTMNLIPSDPQS